MDEQWEAALEAVAGVPCLRLCCASEVIIRASAVGLEELLRWLVQLAQVKFATRGATPSELCQLEVAGMHAEMTPGPGASDRDSAALSKVVGEMETILREIGVHEDWLAGIPEASVLRTHRAELSNLNRLNHERILAQAQDEVFRGVAGIDARGAADVEPGFAATPHLWRAIERTISKDGNLWQNGRRATRKTS